MPEILDAKNDFVAGGVRAIHPVKCVCVCACVCVCVIDIRFVSSWGQMANS